MLPFTRQVEVPRAQQGGFQKALGFGLILTPFDFSRSRAESWL